MDEQLSVADAVRLLRHHWRPILVTTALATLMAIALALWLPPVYRAEVVVVANVPGQTSSPLGSQFEDLASVAGVNLTPGGAKDEALGVLRSRALAQDFVRENNLLPVLFKDKWDSDRQSWKSSLKPSDVPTIWSGGEYLREDVRQIVEDKKTGLITLAIEWGDPHIAATWANQLIEKANEQLRQQAIMRSQRNIDFLEQQLKKTSVVQTQIAISHLIESELSTMTLAEGNREYAFRIVDPATPPERKAKPNRRNIVIAGFFIGLFGSAIMALISGRRS